MYPVDTNYKYVAITNDFHKITKILKNNQIVDKTFRIHYTENAFLNSRGIIFVRDIVKLHNNNILIISVYWIHVVIFENGVFFHQM
jgi:hypothetical protein